MGDELEQLKSVLRSLVVSSPTQVTIQSLLRDYRNMIGAPVPVAKYGYRNACDFLKERFSDSFLFGGPPNNPVLTLIVPDTLKHIDKFVQKQKSSSSNKYTPKRRSVPESVVNPPKENQITRTFMLRSKPPQKTEPNKSDDDTLNKQNLAPIKQNGFKPHSDKEVENKNYVESNPSNGPSHCDNALKNFLKKRLPLYNSSQDLDEELSPEKCSNAVPDDDSGRHTCSSGNSSKARRFEQLKSEIMQLITDAPEGVWCTELIRLYRERYQRELNFTHFGYTSIISLAYSLDGVQITRPVDTGDWLLQERRRAAPAPPTLRARRAPAPPTLRARRAPEPDEALPGIDFDPDVFPEDCMHFMESIELVSLSDFRPGAMVEVMVGEVYSPSHFWFLRLGDNYNIAMEDIMDEMSQYYNNEGRDRVLARGAVRVGHYCSTLYENDWHRSLIVKIIDSETVKVRHVDYGTVDTVGVAQLKPLRRCWARLAAQAARARLGAVRPPAAGWRWPRAAAAAFLRLVSNRRLVANVVALDRRDMVAEVLLIDTSSEEDVCIGSELIRAGHADSRPDSALRTLDVYLYPRFEALEGGDTPNYAEIHAYLRDGIALDFVEEYRAHVPPVHAPPDPSPSPSSPSSPPGPSSPSRPASPPSPASASPPERERVSVSDESAPDLPTRIPLLLPDLPTLPKSAPALAELGCELEAPPRRTPAPPQPGPATPPQPGPATPPQPVHRPPLLPTPSYLSPYAPAYVPGLPYAGPPAPHPGSRAQYPGPPGPYPCRPPGGPPPAPSLAELVRAPGVTLSMAECETYRVLSHVNPAAAHWFMVGAMGRAVAVPAPGLPGHQRMQHPSAPGPMHPSPRIRPPPGFGPR